VGEGGVAAPAFDAGAVPPQPVTKPDTAAMAAKVKSAVVDFKMNRIEPPGEKLEVTDWPTLLASGGDLFR
jgi:hypothetical protein